MRIHPLLAAGLFAASVPVMAAPAPLSSTVTRTDDGYLMGSPKAPVKLVVLSAYGCPHCRVLDETMMQPLRRNWIDTGKVSLRYVPYGMFPTDVPSQFLAECGPVSGFFERSARIFRMQTQFTSSYAAASDAQKSRLVSNPATMPYGLAVLSGLDRAAPVVGVPAQAYVRCLANPQIRQTISRRQKLIESRYQIPGTPAVWINGRATGTGSSWPKLEAMLRGAAR